MREAVIMSRSWQAERSSGGWVLKCAKAVVLRGDENHHLARYIVPGRESAA